MNPASAQKRKSNNKDSAAVVLNEVILFSQKKGGQKTSKPLGSIDQILEESQEINMIKRGSYAWEAYLNGMSSERSVVTIDGMRIYAACTDKMDPTTSYVEISNLKKANINNAANHCQTSANIAGSLDLVQQKSNFGAKHISGSTWTGLESNNLHHNIGSSLSFIAPKFYIDGTASYRAAQNYNAGGNKEILYSQFHKINIASNVGFKLKKNQSLEGSIIIDRAYDIGYPALPMDVKNADALIGSITYTHKNLNPLIQNWESKLYYNKIVHIMDDSKRPNLAIRMDMPGRNNTVGFISTINTLKNKHQATYNINGHSNYSFADMTMYAGASKAMYMLTWPGVRTNYLDISASNNIALNDQYSLSINYGIAFQNNIVEDTVGLASLRIFYANMLNFKNRILKRVSPSIQYKDNQFLYSAGISYAERAPSVSEGYGFYLFNSFDAYDYVGNPNLSNEKSVSFVTSAGYFGDLFSVKTSGSIFYLYDYIIGIPQSKLIAMTLNAHGVKVYSQIKNAQIINLSLDANLYVSSKWKLNSKISYRYGNGDSVGALPLMQPFAFESQFKYLLPKSYQAYINIQGNSALSRYNPLFGENAVSSYHIINIGASKIFKFSKHEVTAKIGIDNLLDRYYTTFSDWNRIPRMGRNVFINLIWSY